MKAMIQHRSESSSSLSTWNDIATIIGVPLGAFLTLIGLLLMVNHHREARRQEETPRNNESLARIPQQNATRTSEQRESVDNLDALFRPDNLDGPNAAAWDISLPARASTHMGISSKARALTPTRASTYSGMARHPQYPPLSPPPQRSLVSSRASQITLVDQVERNNPTTIITYPKTAHTAP